MKWDGDMVLTREGVDALRDLSWQTERAQAVVVIPRHPVTVESESVAWIDLGYRFLEPWVYPMGPATTFAKAFEWEVREWPRSARRVVLPEGLVVEVKWLDVDELAHWSDTEAFDDYRTPRKKRELDVLHADPQRAGGGPRGPVPHRGAAGGARRRPRDDVVDGARGAAAVPAAGLLMLRLAPPWDPALLAPGRHDAVELVLADREELRAVRLPHGIRTTTVVVRLADDDRALSLTPRPEWAPLVSVAARPGETTLVFARPVPVHAVVAELGRQAVWPDRVGGRGLVVAGEELRKVPADVDPATVCAALTEPDPVLALGPSTSGCSTRPGARPTPPPSRSRPTPSRSPWPVPRCAARCCTAERLPPALAAALGPAVSAALTAPLDADDPLAREEHAVVLRRAAHTTFSTHAWRRRLGELAGIRVHHQPAVSVVLATRRPELLAHALAQVERQRGVERIELVLAPHGFDAGARARWPAPPRRRRAPGARPTRCSATCCTARSPAAGGDVVLKMDDDDWYGPDFVADLLLARAWSGAELVGTPDDWHYLEPRDQTVRLGSPVEDYKQFVAGGTMLLDVGLLREVGGFRSVPRAVDAHLIGAVRRAGGAVYRTHGLGYLMRKVGTGHTWAEDLDDLTARPGGHDVRRVRARRGCSRPSPSSSWPFGSVELALRVGRVGPSGRSSRPRVGRVGLRVGRVGPSGRSSWPDGSVGLERRESIEAGGRARPARRASSTRPEGQLEPPGGPTRPALSWVSGASGRSSSPSSGCRRRRWPPRSRSPRPGTERRRSSCATPCRRPGRPRRCPRSGGGAACRGRSHRS